MKQHALEETDLDRIASEPLFFLITIRGSMTVMTRSASCCFLVLLFSLTSLCNVNAKLDLQTEDRDDLEQELRELWPFVQSADENDFAPQREEALQKIQEVIMTTFVATNVLHNRDISDTL